MPISSIPSPRIIEISDAYSTGTTKQDYLPSNRVVDHARARPWRRTDRRKLLGPGRTIPNPGITQKPGVAGTTKQHDLSVCFVVRHAMASATRRTHWRVLLRPGCSIPYPAVGQIQTHGFSESTK